MEYFAQIHAETVTSIGESSKESDKLDLGKTQTYSSKNSVNSEVYFYRY